MESDKTMRPFRRNRSRIIVIPGEFAGRPTLYEVQTEEWLRKTGRYGRVWNARQRGALAWNTGSSARKALMGAACLHGAVRPKWLAMASARAQEELSRRLLTTRTLDNRVIWRLR